MATPLSGLRTAKSILEKDAGDDINREIDFQLAELSVGVQILQVIGSWWSIESAMTVNLEGTPAVATLQYGTSPAVSEFQLGDPTAGGFEINSEQFYKHYCSVISSFNTDGANAAIAAVPFVWTPPDPVLVVRNVLHRKEQDPSSQFAHTALIHYRYVRLSRDEQIMLFGRGT